MKKTDKRPARARYWARGGPRDKKVRNLMRQMVYERVSVDKDGTRHTGKSQRGIMRRRIGNPKPRFATRAHALKFWNTTRHRYPAR